ncbi:uncharacterized protein PITG_22826 [Phytophthora infestans T30-4]|uniref:Secreted protein n=1 Tax=Phytophthora infestans (strain T30-4) TaxID=403677 RepID=D0N8M9_PHYIT|nr:uncharacterized protein PITG_22826 [Phytophthora infestans T30-4]EEY53914.1 conserved hypothetical protein [Phytophthora infestans T30-4]|eukprot:XP_002904545.1 conserved hypothetical protein [Phytophthora infestans T30-4]
MMLCMFFFFSIYLYAVTIASCSVDFSSLQSSSALLTATSSAEDGSASGSSGVAATTRCGEVVRHLLRCSGRSNWSL